MARRGRVGNRRAALERRREKLHRHVAKVLGRDSHLRVAFGADRPLAELAGHAARRHEAELGAEAEEAELSLLHVLLDVDADREALELRLRYHRPDVHDFFERQRQPVRLQLVSPLVLVQGVLRPRVHRAEVRRGDRRVLLRRRRSHAWRQRCRKRLWVFSRLSWLRSRWRHWLAVGRLQALTADNCVPSDGGPTWLTLRREIVGCAEWKRQLVWRLGWLMMLTLRKQWQRRGFFGRQSCWMDGNSLKALCTSEYIQIHFLIIKNKLFKLEDWLIKEKSFWKL